MVPILPAAVDLKHEVQRLKKQKNAIVLAHYYQEAAIQEVADFVGDSLGLSQKAAETNADIIVFAGVHFMAETAKILNPRKKVLLPETNAGCSLADSCPPEQFRDFISKHPNHAVVSYINCSAAVKAMSNVICTSANALQVVESFPMEQQIIFAPDRNLGKYISRRTGRNLVLWDGVCEVHEAFSLEKLAKRRQDHPLAKLVAHPESSSGLLDQADFIGSTSAMIKYIAEDPALEYIVATEAGILHQMRISAPTKHLIPAPAIENNTCACSECRFMKLNSLEKLYRCLRDENPEITLAEDLRLAALKPLQRMLSLSHPATLHANKDA